MSLKELLTNNEYWDETYNKMILKQTITKEDKNLLWTLKEVYREDIVDSLLNNTYTWSVPRKVEIAKSDSNKKRIVYMYNIKDRYILGVLYRVISDFYCSTMSKSCFSYKKKVNTSNAIKYIRENKTEQMKYGVKVDIHAYFNSVSRQRVLEIIEELFGEQSKLSKELNEDITKFKKTIDNLMLNDTVTFKGKELQEWKSLIPGCAFGSLFANMCLKPCDDYFDNETSLGNCIYARYSDDIIVLAETKEKLQQYLDKIIDYITEYGLTMNPNKYTWFEPGDNVEYLGLKLLGDGRVDISDHAKKKIKKQIHRWCRKGRMEIERDGKSFEQVAKRIIRQLNNKNFKCYIKNEATFGWCHYAFRYINTIESLTEIDFYTRDTLRALKTGKHNKANVKALSNDDLHNLGWVSLVDLYMLYKKDFDYYCEVIELL